MCALLAQELGNVLSFAWPQLSCFSVGTCILSAPQMDVRAQAGNSQVIFAITSGAPGQHLAGVG